MRRSSSLIWASLRRNCSSSCTSWHCWRTCARCCSSTTAAITPRAPSSATSAALVGCVVAAIWACMALRAALFSACAEANRCSKSARSASTFAPRRAVGRPSALSRAGDCSPAGSGGKESSAFSARCLRARRTCWSAPCVACGSVARPRAGHGALAFERCAAGGRPAAAPPS